MFAGRYVWWNMMAAMAYLFFSIYFYYLTWLVIRVSGCAAVNGSCGALETNLNAIVRPYGLVGCGIVVLAAGIMRIRFLRMSPLWGLALFVWFGASADFFFGFGNLWFAKTPMATILDMMPIETLFLAAIILFMSFPVELYKKSPEGGLRVVYFVAGFTASYSFSFTIANSEQALAYVRLITGSEDLVAAFGAFQIRMRELLSMGNEGMVPMVVALGIFISSLSYLIVLRKQPGGTPAAAVAAA